MTESTQCRLAEPGDRAQVKALWKQCFDDTPQFVDWYFQDYYQGDNTLGIFAEQGQRLLASAQVIPYTVSVRGQQLPCGYVVGVDTAPEARHRGYARQLLSACLELQRQRRQPISLLMPFEGQFYYRYGWPFCYFHQQVTVDGRELRCAARAYGQLRQVALQEAAEAMAQVYERFCSQYHGTVCRTEENWRHLLADAAMEDTRCYLLETAQGVEGYLLWTPWQQKHFIREMAWTNSQARAGLLWFLQQQAESQSIDRWPFWLQLPADDSLAGQLAADKKAVVLYPFLMARIVDVKQCLEAICYPVQAGRLTLQVEDAFAPWNQGVFTLELTDHRGQVTAQPQQAVAADCTITIQGLSQLVLGARSVAQLMAQGELQVHDGAVSAQMTALWPAQSNYINEYY